MNERIGAVEKAKPADAEAIKGLVDDSAAQGLILSRPLSEIYSDIRDFYVYREGDEVKACVALHIHWEDMGEIRAMAMKEGSQDQGIDNHLIRACLGEAEAMKLTKIFLLTGQEKEAFFESFGFSQANIDDIPLILWRECHGCYRYPNNCNEIAMVSNLQPQLPA